MAEKVTIGNAELWHGDCREVLPLLRGVDAIVTDPPYGQNYRAPNPHPALFANKKWNPASRSTPASVTGDDRAFDPQLLLDMDCGLLIWGAHRFSDRLPPGRWLIWDKKPDGSRSFIGDAEAAWMRGDGSMRLFRHLWDGVRKEPNTDDSERQPGTSAQVHQQHTTQKPVRLMTWCLGFMPTAGVICDPYMGSGSTGVAAIRLGRKFVGIELERRYFDIACERIENEQRQARLAV